MSAKYKSPSFLLPNELNTSANTANDTGVNSLYSMDFDSSSSDYIDIGTISSLNAQQNFSISLWFNENVRNLNAVLFSSGTSVSNDIVINASNGTLKINVGGTRNVNITSYSSNVWYHVVLTVENTTAKVYINDGSPTTVTVGSNTSSSSGTLAKIGELSFASGYRFSGKIDEVAIFNRALNTTEINALYDGTGSNIRPSNLIASNLNPVAYYPLGEQAQMQGYLGNEASSEWQFPNGVLQDYVMDFDGVNDFVDLGDLQPSTTSLSISAWAYKTNTSNASIIGRGASVDYGIFVYGGNLQFGLNAGGWTTISTTLPTLNKWFHVLATWNGSIMKLSVNGGTPVTTSKTGTITYTSNNTTIGKNSTLSGFEWDGKMSNLAIWNSDQSANIANIYNNGSPQTSYTVSPQNWWKLNADSVYTPSAPNYTKALSFDGTSSTYIDLNNITSLNSVSKASYSFWFKLTSNTPSSGSNSVALIGSSAKGASCYIYNNNFYIHNFNTQYILVSSGVPSLNEWHHVCCVFDSGVAVAYLDGSSAGTVTEPTLTTTASDFGNNFSVGYSTFYSDYINNGGQISNVALFNSALSASQVSTLFNFGTPETNISFSPQAWWKLDDQTAITDSSGNGHTGTNNGATDISSGVAVTPSWKIPDASGTVNGVSTTLPSTALQQSDLQFDSSYSNYSLSFDGTGDTVSVSGLPTMTGDASISTWINATTNPSFASFLSSRNYSNTANSFSIQNRSGNIYLIIYDTGSTYKIGNFTPSTALIDNWNHIAVIVDTLETDAKVYFNGSIALTVDLTASNVDISDISAGFNISGYSTNSAFPANAGFFDGKIDETSIFNYSLSEAQVLEIYNNGKPKDLSTFSGTAPISWWRLGENAYFDNNSFVVPNSISGAPNGTGSGTITTMISADAPGTYANGIGTNLDILDRVGDAALSTSNSQSYNMIPSDISPYVPQYVGDQIANNFSMTFDAASNTYFNAGNPTELQITGALSISCWFKTTDTNYQFLITKDDATNSCFGVGLRQQKIYATIYSSGLTDIETTTTWIDGNWHNVVFVFTPSTSMEIFVDGNSEIKETTGIPSSIDNDPVNLNIGRRGNNTRYYTGKIDEVAIWNTALNADQIKFDLYEPSLPLSSNKTADLVNNPNLPNPVAWYRMGD